MDIPFDYAMLSKVHGKRELIPYKSSKWIQKALEDEVIFIKTYKNNRIKYFVNTSQGTIELEPGDLVILFNDRLYVKSSDSIFDEYLYKATIRGI